VGDVHVDMTACGLPFVDRDVCTVSSCWLRYRPTRRVGIELYRFVSYDDAGHSCTRLAVADCMAIGVSLRDLLAIASYQIWMDFSVEGVRGVIARSLVLIHCEKNIRISMEILWRVFRILTEPVRVRLYP